MELEQLLHTSSEVGGSRSMHTALEKPFSFDNILWIFDGKHGLSSFNFVKIHFVNIEVTFLYIFMGWVSLEIREKKVCTETR